MVHEFNEMTVRRCENGVAVKQYAVGLDITREFVFTNSKDLAKWMIEWMDPPKAEQAG